MKSGLRGDRAKGAIPVSLAARASAWAKESLVARAIAIAAGLVVLAVIGGSALAGNPKSGGPAASEGASLAGAMPGGSSAPAPAPVAWVDAGGVTIAGLPGLQVVAVPQGAAIPEAAPALSAPIAASASSRQRASPDDPVDLNTATADDLRRLPGVGAKRAEAILALRARLPGARFRQIEDLLKVKGIGRAMLRRLHPLVRLAAPSTDGGAASA